MQVKRIAVTLSLLTLTLCLLAGCVKQNGEVIIPDWMWPNAAPEDEKGIVTISVGLTFSSHYDGTCRVESVGTCQDTAVIIPPVSPDGDRVVAIGDGAFSGYTEIRSVVLPDGIEDIGKKAFSGCDRLAEINFPDSLRRIGERAFEDCKALREARLSARVVYIGEMAFHGCRRLKTVKFEGADSWQVTLGKSNLWFGKPEKEAQIDSDRLSDPAKAAELLKDDYVYYNWTRK